MDALNPVHFIRTTHGDIAIANLEAQLAGLAIRGARDQLSAEGWAELVDLILTHGQIRGRITDCEQALAIAELRAGVPLPDRLALLARARARACFHDFGNALSDLDAAAHLGLSGPVLDAERASILLAVGLSDEARKLLDAAVARRADFASLGALAMLEAELGNVAEAAALFSDSMARFDGVSPFELAPLEFQIGHMWQVEGDLDLALHWLTAAWRRLPSYVQAEGHLAEVEAALGDRDGAIARLRRLAKDSDDPDYAAQLAGILCEMDRQDQAESWAAYAAGRYDQLIERHPAAFADHAAEFWLTVGGDPPKAAGLARINLEIRKTPRARALLARALAAASASS